MFELLLLSAVIATAYLGPMILRRFGPHQRSYGLMVIANLVLAVVAFAARSTDGPGPITDALGVVAIGAAFCLVMLPPIIRDFGRRAMASDHLRLAKACTGIRELLQPGMGARQEGEIIATILAVREGREQDIIDRLERHKNRVDEPSIRRALDERIIMTYLYAQRWSDAVSAFGRLNRNAVQLGSPQLAVEMVRAYCEEDEIESAAELVRLIEDSPLATEPILAGLVSRARMVFLAFVGRTSAVETIVGPGGPLARMPSAARNFWSGVARLNAGDASGAKTSLAEAARLSHDDPRARELAERQLARAESSTNLGPHSIPLEVAELADRLTSLATDARFDSSGEETSESSEMERPLPRLSSVPLKVMRVTAGFALANLLASVAVYFLYGSISDIGGLIAAGANVKSATLSGEWWRLGTSMFLHVGVAHLALNVYGLWVLGRFVEQIHGPLRAFAIYSLSGLLGALASTYLGGSATAVGASGAVMGLMGAAVTELGIYRKHYPRHWARPLLGALLFLTAAQVAVGFFYPIVDQWGHLGGLVGGAVLGLGLSSHAPLGRIGRIAATGILTVVSTVFLGFAAFSIATTSYTDTLRSYQVVKREIGGLQLSVPASWERVSSTELYDSGIAGVIDLRRLPMGEGVDAAVAARIEDEHLGGALRAGFDTAQISTQNRMALPEPWRGAELEVSVQGSSGTQHHRLVVFARAAGDEIWLGGYYHPSALTEYLEPVLSDVLTSVRPVPGRSSD